MVRTTPDQVDKLVRQVEKKIDVLKTFVYTPEAVSYTHLDVYKRQPRRCPYRPRWP